jgi:phosphomannomutase
LQRFQADADYLAEIEQHYHAMRPLRIVVDSASMPLVQYLERLAAGVACQVIPSRVSRRELSQLVRAEKAHFAASINGDGETCNILDEQGGAVAAERLLQLLARNTSQTTIERLEQLGGTPVVLGGIRRAEMAAAMQTSGAILGGGPGGRFWHLVAGIPLPDALMTVTRLLERLSQSDEPLSRVLDRDAPTR